MHPVCLLEGETHNIGGAAGPSLRLGLLVLMACDVFGESSFCGLLGALTTRRRCPVSAGEGSTGSLDRVKGRTDRLRDEDSSTMKREVKPWPRRGGVFQAPGPLAEESCGLVGSAPSGWVSWGGTASGERGHPLPTKPGQGRAPSGAARGSPRPPQWGGPD